MDSCSTDESCSGLSPAARQRKAAAGGGGRVMCDGMTFTLTEGNEVAEVVRGAAAPCVLGSESFFDAGTGTRHHFVDVQGEAEAMLFLVSVREDQRRIVAIRRF
ncbi:hypothetical protein PVAP13_9NG653900 [Panicum virgatum]|uniref:Uncharacterized protein n=1 Tax=Panicum virgatum TaxID=38727 RepID=A0A8T0N1D0_PANVG|nr:hypothetical protein PVAP13_9NG653900 [Panicum virgatum]